MNLFPTKIIRLARSRGFSLVEMLVVIAIMSILMTAGSIGISNLGGRGVTSGVDTCEALVDEARMLSVGKSIRSAVLVSRELTNNPAEDRRRILVAHEELGTDGDVIRDASGDPVSNPNWVLTSRGALLPEQTFYSQDFSRVLFETSKEEAEYISDSKIKNAKASYKGTYYIYRLNSQGIFYDPRETPNNKLKGASFVIGSGNRLLTQPSTSHPPKVNSSARRDFGGFVIWRNGRTSVFRTPSQISSQITSITPGTAF